MAMISVFALQGPLSCPFVFLKTLSPFFTKISPPPQKKIFLEKKKIFLGLNNMGYPARLNPIITTLAGSLMLEHAHLLLTTD